MSTEKLQVPDPPGSLEVVVLYGPLEVCRHPAVMVPLFLADCAVTCCVLLCLAGTHLSFAKQQPRPAPVAVTDCPTTLGPGAYHRSGPLPATNTGQHLLAGHSATAASHAPDFSKGSPRPCSSPAYSTRTGAAPTAAATAALPGLWGWAADKTGYIDMMESLESTMAAPDIEQQVQAPTALVTPPAAAMSTTVSTDQQPGHNVLQLGERPSSRAALVYARSQRTDSLMQHEDQADDYCSHSSSSSSRRPRPVSAAANFGAHAAAAAISTDSPSHPHQLLHQPRVRPPSALHVRQRPATAQAAVLPGKLGKVAAHTAIPSTGNLDSFLLQQSQHIIEPCSRTGVLGLQELQRYSSTGLAGRVKGGTFSTSSRAAAAKVLRAMSASHVTPPASVAVLQQGTELAYDPNTEAQAHMRRPPGWKLPPNRVASSRKWAQRAAQAAMQL
jgi:hypothetical protein